MKIETILDAMVMADRRRLYPVHNPKILLYPNAERQYNTFRARILRMFSVSKSINADLLTEIEMQNARIAELEALPHDEIILLEDKFTSSISQEWDTPEEDEAWKDL